LTETYFDKLRTRTRATLVARALRELIECPNDH
jgi:hypothetical protein